MADYANKTKADLQALAEERGIKKPGVGWPKCCPPNGEKADIITALERSDQENGIDYNRMTVDQLKELAEKRGIKQPGVGWGSCCPPKGNKGDIIAALQRRAADVAPEEPKEPVTPSTPAPPAGVGPGRPRAPSTSRTPLTESMLSARYGAMTKVDLVALARQQGCPTKGLKADIIRGLVTHHLRHNTEPDSPTSLAADSPDSKPFRTPVSVLDFDGAVDSPAGAEESPPPALRKSDWCLPGPASQAELEGLEWLGRLDQATFDWINVSNGEACPDLGISTGCFIKPPYPPKVCVSFGGNDQRVAVQRLHESGHHVGADPFAICDFLRDALMWRAHDIFVIDELTDAYPKWRWSYTWAQQQCLVQLYFVSKSWAMSQFCLMELDTYQAMLLTGEATGTIAFACLQSHFTVTTAEVGAEQMARLRGTFAGYVQERAGEVEVNLLDWIRHRAAEVRGEVSAARGAKAAREAVPRDCVYDLSAVWDWILSKGVKCKTDVKVMSQHASELLQFVEERCKAAGQLEEYPARVRARLKEQRAMLDRGEVLDHGFVFGDWEPDPSELAPAELPPDAHLLKYSPPSPVRNPYVDDGHRLNLNLVTAEQMAMKLPGIGTVTAQRIFDNRPYTTVEELLEVEGIGRTKYEHMLPFVTASDQVPPRARRDPVYVAYRGDRAAGPFASVQEALHACKDGF